MPRLLALLVTTAALAAGCAGDSDTPARDTGSSAAAQPTVREIDNVLALRAAFNADRGKPRILLIFSPT